MHLLRVEKHPWLLNRQRGLAIPCPPDYDCRHAEFLEMNCSLFSFSFCFYSDILVGYEGLEKYAKHWGPQQACELRGGRHRVHTKTFYYPTKACPARHYCIDKHLPSVLFDEKKDQSPLESDFLHPSFQGFHPKFIYLFIFFHGDMDLGR